MELPSSTDLVRSMVSVTLISGSLALGVILGVMMACLLPTLLAGPSPHLRSLQAVVVIATTGLFVIIACRLGGHVDGAADAVLAAVAVPLAVVDIVEQRLPNILMAVAYPATIAAVVIMALVDGTIDEVPRSLAAMAIVIAFYLLIAMLSRGGLGAGDLLTELPGERHCGRACHYP